MTVPSKICRTNAVTLNLLMWSDRSQSVRAEAFRNLNAILGEDLVNDEVSLYSEEAMDLTKLDGWVFLQQKLAAWVTLKRPEVLVG